VSQVPFLSNSRARARTRSVQPVRARESERRLLRSGTAFVVRRWAIRAWEVCGGREADVAVREGGIGIVDSLEELVEVAMATGGERVGREMRCITC